MEEAAAFRMPGHDPIGRTNEAGKRPSAGKGGHVRQVVLAVTMDAIRFEHRTHAGKRSSRVPLAEFRASRSDEDGRGSRTDDDDPP